MKRLLCFFGLHAYEPYSNLPRAIWRWSRCSRCGKEKGKTSSKALQVVDDEVYGFVGQSGRMVKCETNPVPNNPDFIYVPDGETHPVLEKWKNSGS